jgi:hypothetical protein
MTPHGTSSFLRQNAQLTTVVEGTMENAAYCIISDVKGRDGSLPDPPGTNGLTSALPPQYIQDW